MSRFSHSSPRNGTFAWKRLKPVEAEPHQEDDFNFVRGLAWAITFCAVLTTAFILVMLWGGFWA